MKPVEPPHARLHYTMTLFITGATRRSLVAVEKVQAFCDEELRGDYDLEVVDLYRSPERAAIAQVVAAPTLIRQMPSPKRIVIGSMVDRDRLRAAIKVIR